jgi:unsaturated rhamnogalacturonyl hydrolase
MRVLWLKMLLLLLSFFVAVGCASNNNSASSNDDDTADDDTGASPSPVEAAQALADTWIDTYAPETMGWSWDSGLLMLGMWELYRITGVSRYHDYAQAWMDYHIGIGYTIAFNDHVPPARVALRLWLETGDAKYRQVVDDTRYYIFHQAVRLPDGGLNHMGWISGEQIWVDTLFMVTPFLNELGEQDSDQACFDEAVLQFDVFAAHLRDSDTGLYRHMYDAKTDGVMPPVEDYWGRGNAWVVAASGLALDVLPTGQDGYARIRDRWKQQVAAMSQLIDSSNRWRTIMNRPNTYLETSVGPLVAFGIYRAAQADEASETMLELARRGLRGALDQVVTDPSGDTLLLGTSYGTGPSTWELYNYVLKGEQVSYGLGALMIAVAAYADVEPDQALPASQPTTESYIHPPADNDPTEWGYFYLARGDFYSADTSFNAAPADDAAAQFGAGVIETVRYAFSVLDDINRYMLGETDLSTAIDSVLSDGREVGQDLALRLPAAENDPTFSRVMERFVMTEQGGSTALGSVEVDRGEAYILDAAGHLLWGLADVVDSFGSHGAQKLLSARDKLRLLLHPGQRVNHDQLVAGLDELIAGDDLLLSAIDEIMAETDDQSDDLIPKNLLELTGDFKLPGILLPTPVTELLGPLADFFAGKPMPATLIQLLQDVRGLLQFVRNLVG